jgi:hypothetical protein
MSLPVVSYGCETWVTHKGRKQTDGISEQDVKRIFGYKRGSNRKMEKIT